MKGLLLALVLAICVAELLAVECYNCNYIPGVSTSESCMDPFNARSSQPTTVCSGECSKAVTSANGESIITRTCLPGAVCLAGCSTLAGTEVCFYCCDSDKCNGASSVTFDLINICVTVLAGCITSAW